MSVVIVWMQSQVETFWSPFGCQVLRFTSKGKTHCARIHGFVHAIAYRALCTHSGLCARRVRELSTPSTGSHLTKEFKIATYDQNNDRILVNRMSSLWF